MERQWYLVQISLEPSDQAWPTFDAADRDKSHEYSRWWQNWYEYSRDSITNDISFGDRIIFRSSINPDTTKYIQQADSIDFNTPNTILADPLNFKEISSLITLAINLQEKIGENLVIHAH